MGQSELAFVLSRGVLQDFPPEFIPRSQNNTPSEYCYLPKLEALRASESGCEQTIAGIVVLPRFSRVGFGDGDFHSSGRSRRMILGLVTPRLRNSVSRNSFTKVIVTRMASGELSSMPRAACRSGMLM